MSEEASSVDEFQESCAAHKEQEARVPIILPELAQDSRVKAGDHLYKWSSFAGIPGLVQNHAIVSKLHPDGTVEIVDCNALLRGINRDEACYTISWDLTDDQHGGQWRLVHYQACWWRRQLNRSGTCTITASDPPGLVLARLHFLLVQKENLPSHHFLKANSECVAVWCKTGAWSTLQASSLLHVTAAGQVKSATTLAAYASSQTVLVTAPAGGLWGMLGFTTTTKVSLLAVQPLLLPAIIGYGVLSVGGPLWMLHRAKHAWNETTRTLNEEFWQAALENPEEFASSITEWSEMM
jgi:hypothetical protein